jgi:hypothetical protein
MKASYNGNDYPALATAAGLLSVSPQNNYTSSGLQPQRQRLTAAADGQLSIELFVQSSLLQLKRR